MRRIRCGREWRGKTGVNKNEGTCWGNEMRMGHTAATAGAAVGATAQAVEVAADIPAPPPPILPSKPLMARRYTLAAAAIAGEVVDVRTVLPRD